ncbi:metallophosphoesterase [Paraburkholderia phymatum]|uniref:Metallophosphoesterase n=1 Tax=Paraburkholderia phymatum (strain DSM 17167 / CIP 108236 / LMG 21445 / STM815) TaxID=391038 RepID=B2JQG9_PARP8|nr:metallophosphoesterase [Paraburkholderia phymatum]ACC73510.1 metallophosphoesterase [Paraburkholderia phymatum STM815]
MDSTLFTLVQHHPANRTGRDFVVGDLHGCLDALRFLLREIEFAPSQDRLFSVGDLVDRGSQSEEALALLDKPWFHAVLGNHEDTLCAVAEGKLKKQWWYGIGGLWSAHLSADKLRAYAHRLRTLPLVRVIGSGSERFNVLHAEFLGTDAELDADDFSADMRQQLLWGRNLAMGTADPRSQSGLSLTYCGHTPMREVQQIGAQVFIDTGAFGPGGKLTIVEARTTNRWSVTVDVARSVGASALALP